MDKYDELKERLAEFLLRDEVVEDEETISAYNLFMFMVTKFNDLVYVHEYAPKTIKEKANNALKTKYGLGRHFRKKKADVALYDKVHVYFDSIENTFKIVFCNTDNIYTKILKDIGDVNLYYGYGDNKVDDCVLDACIDEVYITFNILEEFYNLFKKAGKLETLNKKGISQEFSFDGFKYELTYNKNGQISANLSFSEDVDPKYIQNRTWYGDRLPITDNIEEHGDELLKRFPIKFSELDEISQTVVRDYLKSKGKIKKYK